MTLTVSHGKITDMIGCVIGADALAKVKQSDPHVAYRQIPDYGGWPAAAKPWPTLAHMSGDTPN